MYSLRYASSFLNVAHKVSDTAFDYAYRILNDRLQQGVKNGNLRDTGLFIPVAVNCALSCELFLKSLLPAGSRGHKLYNDLFTKLDIKMAENIRSSVITIIQDTTPAYSATDFEQDLKSNEDAFLKWRYFHECQCELSFNLSFMIVFEACLKAIATASETH